MRVLAIDPGTLRMGYGVVDAEPTPEADDYGVIALSASMPIEQRLYQLHTHILKHDPRISPPTPSRWRTHSWGGASGAFVKSALAIGQAQAVVLIGAASQGVPVHRYAPASVKRAVTDYGGATKEQVQRMTVSTLGLHEMPDSDAADALAVGLCHLQHLQGRRFAGARDKARARFFREC